MKIVYMGTPDFAVGPLEALIAAGHEITAVVCQPDKPKGRSGEPAPCPVKLCALKHGLSLFQPQRIRRPEAVEQLKAYAADIYVVAAFGQILSEELLGIPRYGCVNIHASLLPKYRGASPIQWAVLNGDEYSGISIMQMDAGIDTGDILLQKKLKLNDDETGGSLFKRLAECGAEAIVEALAAIESGSVKPLKQNEAEASHVGMLKKEDGLVDWDKPAVQLERQVRGLYPWPGTYTYLRGKQLKLFKCALRAGSVNEDRAAAAAGVVSLVAKDHFCVGCGSGELMVYELQLEGKKRMSAADFLRGVKLSAGDKLG